MAARCNFKKGSLDEILRDKFVCGLQHEYIRSCLLTEKDNLTFNRSVEIATGLEGAKKHADLMKQETKKEVLPQSLRSLKEDQQRACTL